MADLERIYNIPLRREWEKAPRYRRAKKAVKAVKEFLARHMKVYDRDLEKIKIGRWLNMHIWQQGIKKPPAMVKVKATKEGDVVRAELVELPKKAKREAEKEAKEKAEGEKKKKEKETVKLKVPFTGKKAKEEEKKEGVKPEEKKEEVKEEEKLEEKVEVKTEEKKEEKKEVKTEAKEEKK